MRFPTLLTLLASAAGTALAHMEMIDPFPILSPANPAVHWSVKNYDMMAPLQWAGDNLPYPCKGYLWSTPASERNVQKTWPAGSWQSVTLGPNGAPHKGGSCQMSLSYDYGRTWQVILSIIGGCPIDSYKMDFELPAEAPSGEAVFAWSWFNHEGNREMYQNCAIINVSGGGAGLNTRDFPPPFVANAGVNGCSTIEGVDPVFPNPGKNVRFGGPYRGQVITEQRGIRGSSCVDQFAGETPAGSRGRALPETTTSSAAATTTAAPSSSSITTASSSSTTTSSTETISPSPSTASSSTETTSPSPSTTSAIPSPSTTAAELPTTTSLASTSITSSSTIGNQYNAGPLSESSSTTTTSTTLPSSTTSPSEAASSLIFTTSASPEASSTATTPSTTSASDVTASPTSASTEAASPITSLTSTTSTTLIASTEPTSSVTLEATTSPSSSSSSATATAAPTSRPGGSTCVRRAKRSHFDSSSSPQRHVRLVRRAVKPIHGAEEARKA